MILRRITAHVKAQNWTAVALDFVIVVVGVFIGIQVSNWNETRALRVQEKSYLRQLRDEVKTNEKFLNFLTDYYATGVEAGGRALTYLEGDADCTQQCEALLIDFFHASQIWGTGFITSSFRETDRLGFPSNEETRISIRQFYEFMLGWDSVNQAPPAFRENVRKHFSPAAAAILWEDCYIIVDGTLEVLSRDCAEALKATDTAAMLGSIRADASLAPDLRYWMGQNIFALQEYPQAERLAAEAISSLTEELGDGP